MQRPLVLLVAAGRAERELRLAVAQRERRRERRPRSRPRRERRRQARPRARTSARACRAASRAPGSPASSAASRRSASRRRGCRSGRRRRGARCRRGVGSASARRRRPSPPAATSSRQPRRRRAAARPTPVADERAALVVVRAREQPLERDVVTAVAVERLAVGERELRALDDDWTYSASRSSARGRSPSSSASCWRKTGPWPHGAASCTPSARGSRTSTGASTVACQAREVVAGRAARRSRAEKRSISSATKPS